MAKPRQPYHSLEDYLISQPLTIDGQADDGWGAPFPVKGREIDATVLFADITRFSSRTVDLTPAETLYFVNNFFAWISAEALEGRPGIVDKYIGDELMIVFSEEFGSEDPFLDAVQAARGMAQNDFWSFLPHVGLASGPVIVGYVGTPIKYNCSVFGAPVAMAARCASVPPNLDGGPFSSSIVFPADEWADRDLDEVFPAGSWRDPDGTLVDKLQSWELLPPREIEIKNLGAISVQEIVNRALHAPSDKVEDIAREWVSRIREEERSAAGDDAARRSGQ